VPPAGGSERRWNWRGFALIVLAVLLLVMGSLIFLVLTGIIAEPETVIENMVRAIFNMQR
jgi:hypothetical protein